MVKTHQELTLALVVNQRNEQQHGQSIRRNRGNNQLMRDFPLKNRELEMAQIRMFMNEVDKIYNSKLANF